MNYRKYLFDTLHDIVYYSNGAFSYDIVYNMPIWLRTFTFNKLKKELEPKNNSNTLDNLSNDKEFKEKLSKIKIKS